MTIHALAAAIEAGQSPRVLDVRSASEYARGHVPGAINLPFWMLPFQLGTLRTWLSSVSDRHRPPQMSPLVVYCGHGPRAWMARTVLARNGYRDVSLLEGHMHAWRRAGLPEERGSDFCQDSRP